MKIVIFILLMASGFVLIKYCKWLVDSTGIRFYGIERVLGPGGTYTILKLMGVAAIAFSFYYAVNM